MRIINDLIKFKSDIYKSQDQNEYDFFVDIMRYLCLNDMETCVEYGMSTNFSVTKTKNVTKKYDIANSKERETAVSSVIPRMTAAIGENEKPFSCYACQGHAKSKTRNISNAC